MSERTLVAVTERLLRVPEVARALGIDGPGVYHLIDAGNLHAGKGDDGLVYVSEQALRDYQERQASAHR